MWSKSVSVHRVCKCVCFSLLSLCCLCARWKALAQVLEPCVIPLTVMCSLREPWFWNGVCPATGLSFLFCANGGFNIIIQGRLTISDMHYSKSARTHLWPRCASFRSAGWRQSWKQQALTLRQCKARGSTARGISSGAANAPSRRHQPQHQCCSLHHPLQPPNTVLLQPQQVWFDPSILHANQSFRRHCKKLASTHM